MSTDEHYIKLCVYTQQTGKIKNFGGILLAAYIDITTLENSLALSSDCTCTCLITYQSFSQSNISINTAGTLDKNVTIRKIWNNPQWKCLCSLM